MVPELSVVCTVHDRALADEHLVPCLDALESHPPVRFLVDNGSNALGRNIAHLYNVLRRLDGPPRRVFIHPDVRFASDFTARLTATIADLDRQGVSWGALGTVGRSWDGDYVWGHEVDEASPVCTIDSCCLVLDTRHGLTFDERTFDEFHCYVEDYCLQCHAAGLGVFVAPAPLEHLGSTHAERGSRWGGYDRYRRRLERKWRHQFPGLTTT